MILKLSDDNETIIDLKKVCFLRLGVNYAKTEREGTCYCPIVGFFIDKFNCHYTNPIDEKGEPDLKKHSETWEKLSKDYQAIENHLLSK